PEDARRHAGWQCLLRRNFGRGRPTGLHPSIFLPVLARRERRQSGSSTAPCAGEPKVIGRFHSPLPIYLTRRGRVSAPRLAAALVSPGADPASCRVRPGSPTSPSLRFRRRKCFMSLSNPPTFFRRSRSVVSGSHAAQLPRNERAP